MSNTSFYIVTLIWAVFVGLMAEARGRSFWGYFLLSFVFTPLISMVIVLIAGNKRTAAPVSDEAVYVDTSSDSPVYVDEESEPTAEQPQLPAKETVCPNCGAPLAPGRRFCEYCGSKTE